MLLGLTFCGTRGLMVNSTAEREEVSSDGSWRLVTGFRPLGNSFGSFLGGTFNVRQELIDCSWHPGGATATIRMSFAPYRQKDHEPAGSFLWTVVPSGEFDHVGSLWGESINTDETSRLGIPELRIKAGSRWPFRFGHNRLIHRAALRIAYILNNQDERTLDFEDYAPCERLDFRSAKRETHLLQGLKLPLSISWVVYKNVPRRRPL